jgi:phospholipase/carboxylesterase
MTAAEVEAVAKLVNPLLRALEMLALIARHFHPPHLEDLMASVGTPDDELRTAQAAQPQWPHHLAAIAAKLNEAANAVLQAFAGLREALDRSGDVRQAYRALRLTTTALEALYPLAGVLASVDRFFLDPSLRSDEALQRQFPQVPASDGTGLRCFANDGAERGGFWLYVPEYYSSSRNWPLVMALHGGSGTGRLFLWSWLRDVRSRGAILAAPTSIGATWALMGDDPDTANLARILDRVRSDWNIDPTRLLLTGMSDGGTFTYVSGLEAGSLFTHLAPVSAAFHPMLAQMAGGARMRGLPIHIVHGALDWMFPVELARQAHRVLAAAGANVTYREVEDLSHTYPREMNAPLLSWLDATPAGLTSSAGPPSTG